MPGGCIRGSANGTDNRIGKEEGRSRVKKTKSRKVCCSRLVGVRERIKGRKETGEGGKEDVCVPLERASAKDEGAVQTVAKKSRDWKPLFGRA